MLKKRKIAIAVAFSALVFAAAFAEDKAEEKKYRSEEKEGRAEYKEGKTSDKEGKAADKEGKGEDKEGKKKKGWYQFMKTKKWYQFIGQSDSGSSATGSAGQQQTSAMQPAGTGNAPQGQAEKKTGF